MEAARLAGKLEGMRQALAILSPHSGKVGTRFPANAGQPFAGNSPEQTMVTDTGKEPLAKAKKAQRQVATPAATDVWVNDGQGVPLLVVTLPMNEHLTLVLESIVAEVQTLMCPQRRFTVLFDRGGFSAKLFRRLLAMGVDIITYRRGKRRKVPRHCFQEQHVDVDGKRWTYRVYEQARVRVGRLRAAEAPAVGRWTGVFVDAANHGAA